MSQDENDDEEARKSRAARLRAHISSLTPRGAGAAREAEESAEPGNEPDLQTNEDAPGDASRPVSPREFIHRRMHELDEEKKKED